MSLQCLGSFIARWGWLLTADGARVGTSFRHFWIYFFLLNGVQISQNSKFVTVLNCFTRWWCSRLGQIFVKISVIFWPRPRTVQVVAYRVARQINQKSRLSKLNNKDYGDDLIMFYPYPAAQICSVRPAQMNAHNLLQECANSIAQLQQQAAQPPTREWWAVLSSRSRVLGHVHCVCVCACVCVCGFSTVLVIVTDKWLFSTIGCSSIHLLVWLNFFLEMRLNI